TGSGKSFLLNFLTLHAQQYDPLTVIFDLGHSYRNLSRLLGGSYLALDLRQREVGINPFAFEPTPDHLHFLHGFVRVLLEGADTYRLSTGSVAAVHAAGRLVDSGQSPVRLLLIVVTLAKVVSLAVVSFGLIASAVCALLGPIFVP